MRSEFRFQPEGLAEISRGSTKRDPRKEFAKAWHPGGVLESIKSRSCLGVLRALAMAAVVTGCTVGPNYKRPAVNTPTEYRRAASDTNRAVTSQSFADLGWWEM